METSKGLEARFLTDNGRDRQSVHLLRALLAIWIPRCGAEMFGFLGEGIRREEGGKEI